MINEVKRYSVSCDACDNAKTEDRPTISGAVEVAKQSGWWCDAVHTLWLCPQCKEMLPKVSSK